MNGLKDNEFMEKKSGSSRFEVQGLRHKAEQ
jgi:hypothetical protein